MERLITIHAEFGRVELALECREDIDDHTPYFVLRHDGPVLLEARHVAALRAVVTDALDTAVSEFVRRLEYNDADVGAEEDVYFDTI